MDEGARMLLKDAHFNARLAHTLAPSSVNAADYMAVFYTGGHGTMWDFRGNAGLESWLECRGSEGNTEGGGERHWTMNRHA